MYVQYVLYCLKYYNGNIGKPRILTQFFFEILFSCPLKNLYRAVEDIDLFTGLMAEKPLAGALLSETTANILGEQFERLRKCDRFWHENGGQAGSFTPSKSMQKLRG